MAQRKPAKPQRKGHVLTDDDRRKGAAAATEVKLAKRAEAERLARERLVNLTEAAVKRLEQLLDSEDEQIAVRAARDILDRALGKAVQPLKHAGDEGGPVVVRLAFDPDA
jgi:hypothetical protein